MSDRYKAACREWDAEQARLRAKRLDEEREEHSAPHGIGITFKQRPSAKELDRDVRMLRRMALASMQPITETLQ